MRDSLISAQRVADEDHRGGEGGSGKDGRRRQGGAEKTVADAQAQAKHLTETAQSTADAARAEYESMKAAAENYRASFRKLVEGQLEVLKANDILFK